MREGSEKEVWIVGMQRSVNPETSEQSKARIFPFPSDFLFLFNVSLLSYGLMFSPSFLPLSLTRTQ